MKRWANVAPLVLFLILPLAGCDSGAPTAKVEGVVTLDGKPLPDIRVLFQPDNKGTESGGVGSFALTDSDGKFVLKLSDSQEIGAIVGNHTVTLADKLSEDPADSDAGTANKTPKSRIPMKYGKELPKFEVKSGTVNEAKIELSSK